MITISVKPSNPLYLELTQSIEVWIRPRSSVATGYMVEYRVYALDRFGRVDGPPRVIEAADDTVAIEKAKQLVEWQVLEIWDGARVVARLEPTRDSKR